MQCAVSRGGVTCGMLTAFSDPWMIGVSLQVSRCLRPSVIIRSVSRCKSCVGAFSNDGEASPKPHNAISTVEREESALCASSSLNLILTEWTQRMRSAAPFRLERWSAAGHVLVHEKKNSQLARDENTVVEPSP